jgi:hypothetical protein
MEIACPVCQADDEHLKGTKGQHGQLALECLSCGHQWARTPNRICPRCSSSDIEVGVVEDSWAFVDPEAAKGDQGAAFEYLDKESLRCRSCSHRWEVVLATSPPPADDDGLREFRDDDDGYLRWLRGHYRGFVLNTYRTPSADYLILHDATCQTISGVPARGDAWTKDYIKICAMKTEALTTWSLTKTGAAPTWYGICRGA